MEWLLLAQAVVQVGGIAYNSFANNSNANKKKQDATRAARKARKRLAEDVTRGKERLAQDRTTAINRIDTQKKTALDQFDTSGRRIGEDVTRAKEDVATVAQSDIASRVAAGQVDLGQTARATDRATSDIMTQANRGFEDIAAGKLSLYSEYNTNVAGIETSASRGYEDIQRQSDRQYQDIEDSLRANNDQIDLETTTANINSALNLVGSAIGTYAGISDYQSKLNSSQSMKIGNSYKDYFDSSKLDSALIPSKSQFDLGGNYWKNKSKNYDWNMGFNGNFGNYGGY